MIDAHGIEYPSPAKFLICDSEKAARDMRAGGCPKRTKWSVPDNVISNSKLYMTLLVVKTGMPFSRLANVIGCLSMSWLMSLQSPLRNVVDVVNRGLCFIAAAQMTSSRSRTRAVDGHPVNCTPPRRVQGVALAGIWCLARMAAEWVFHFGSDLTRSTSSCWAMTWAICVLLFYPPQNLDHNPGGCNQGPSHNKAHGDECVKCVCERVWLPSRHVWLPSRHV